MRIALQMQADQGPSARLKKGEKGHLAAAAEANPRSTSSPSSSSSSSSSSSFSSISSSSSSSSQRRHPSSDQKRRNKTHRERQHTLPKPWSEPAMLSMEESMAFNSDAEQSFEASHAVYRRCMTDTNFKNVHGLPSQAAPDLLQLFNIFQFNTPERPPARMLVNVTLIGSIQAIRLLVAYDASVQDVIKASLKAYAKEGRLPRHCSKHQAYGLHYSPFCLESIDPTETVCSLGTRSFFLSPSSQQVSNPSQSSREGKPWWNILGLLST